jgi:hypothetical protein
LMRLQFGKQLSNLYTEASEHRNWNNAAGHFE